MKVSNLIKLLNETTQPDDEICVLFWTKDNFGIETEEELNTWNIVCEQFDNWDSAGWDEGDWIATAIADNAGEEQ